MTATVSLLHSYLIAASAHDWDTVLALLTDDFKLTMKPTAAKLPVQTKAQLVETMEGSVKKWFAPGALMVCVIPHSPGYHGY